MISPANALKFSMWLAINHPDAFQAVLNQTVPLTSHRNRVAMGGLGASGTFIPGTRNRMKRSHLRGQFGGLGSAARQGMGSFGDDYGPSFSDVGVSDINVSDSVYSSLSDPVLQDINIDIPSSNFDLNSAAASVDTSGGWWSSIGSSLSSIGSGLSSAVGAVAGAVLNPQTLSAAGNLAATVIKANGANTQQQALLQQQMSRTLTGSGAQPVIYRTNPATGQQVPMYYNSATGQYQQAPVSSGLFGASLGSSSSLSQLLPVVLIGGGLLLVGALIIRK